MPTSARVRPRLEQRRRERDPPPRPPIARAAQLDEPRCGDAGGPAARLVGGCNPAVHRCRALVRVAQRRQQRGRVLLRAAQPAPGHQQRAEYRRAGVLGQRSDRRSGGAGVRVQHVAQLAVGARAGQLGVAQHKRAQVGPARLGLRAEHLDQRERLGGGAGEQPVNVRRRAPNPGPRQLVAEVAQSGGDRLAARRRLRRGLAVEAAQHPVLEQHDPVVEVRRAAVGLAARRTGREREVCGGEEAHARGRQRRVAALELAPRQLALVLTRAGPVPQARDHPRAEVQRPALLHVEQRRHQLAEARLVLVEPTLLAVERLGQPRELLVGSEVAVADDRRRRDLEVDRPEQPGVELGLLGRELLGRRRREADDVHVLAQLLEHGSHHVPPERCEVMALVEYDGPHARGAQRVDARPRAAAQQVGEPPARVRRRRAISRLSDAETRAISRRRRCAAAPVQAPASAATVAASCPVAAARSAAQRASAAPRSAAPGSSKRASAWYVRHATGAPGSAATVPAGAPNNSPVRVHCAWIAEFGARTSAG